MNTISNLIFSDSNRMDALMALRAISLTQGFIAAGFLRNLVWDYLHGKASSTPLNDVDVIHFSKDRLDSSYDLEIESQLNNICPHVNWQVKNQALMHQKNGDPPYTDVVHAMSYWPEKETAVAVRLKINDELEFATPFSLDLLYNLTISHNPARSLATFNRRVSDKQWQSIWPKLKIVL